MGFNEGEVIEEVICIIINYDLWNIIDDVVMNKIVVGKVRISGGEGSKGLDDWYVMS